MQAGCPCCGAAAMRVGLRSWHWQCQSCGYEAADFDPAINQSARHALIDEAARREGLQTLRDRNFRRILTDIARYLPPARGHRSLLDVGAAHGWFVQMAAQRFDARGIEPDHALCRTAIAGGVPLTEGYFPEALATDDRFDVIVFNDVFEHMPDIEATLDACAAHLQADGLLVLNLPSRRGALYRVSKLAARLGLGAPFERLWQKNLPSPHLHYFGSRNLIELGRRHGFAPVLVDSLPAVDAHGLYQRIAYVGGMGWLQRSLMWLALMAALPLLALLESDIMVVILKKAQAPLPENSPTTARGSRNKPPR